MNTRCTIEASEGGKVGQCILHGGPPVSKLGSQGVRAVDAGEKGRGLTEGVDLSCAFQEIPVNGSLFCFLESASSLNPPK